MSEDTKVHAELRDSFGKGFARRLRAAGKIPAVIYGHGTDPVHVALPGHQVSLIVRHANAVLELDVEGKQLLTLVKDVQKDPVHQIIEHIDLLVVKKGEKIQVQVPVVVVDELRVVRPLLARPLAPCVVGIACERSDRLGLAQPVS